MGPWRNTPGTDLGSDLPMDQRTKNDQASPTWNRVIIIAILVVFVAGAAYIVFAPEAGLLQVLALREQRNKLQQELQDLRAEKEHLEQINQRLREKDPLVIEEEARRKGMVRDGEEVYRLEYYTADDSTASLVVSEEDR